MARDVSEREFVNYAKGLGNYCTYGDSRRVLVGVLQAFAVCYPSFIEPLGDLLPIGVRGLLKEAREASHSVAAVGTVSASPNRNEFLEVLRSTAQLSDCDRPGHALRAFLGTAKEKSQERRDAWRDAMPAPLREDWEQSITIDQVQDAGQCL